MNDLFIGMQFKLIIIIIYSIKNKLLFERNETLMFASGVLLTCSVTIVIVIVIIKLIDVSN